MSTIGRAIEIAARAHAGQVDKAGAPYVFHPLRLMLSLDTPEQWMAAALHDVVEDTSVTLADLEAEGFPAKVVHAVRVLTKLPGESRVEAARRAARDPIARAVKLADVADNLDLKRIESPTEKDYARLKEYEQVKMCWNPAEPPRAALPAPAMRDRRGHHSGSGDRLIYRDTSGTCVHRSPRR